MFIVSSGCSTTKFVRQPITSETIQAVIEDESKTLPIEPGDEIGISTTERISISSGNVFYVEMVVKDVNTTRIRGEVDSEPGKEGITSDIIEVKLEGINRISFIEEQEKTIIDGGKVAEVAINIALYPIALAITLLLFSAIVIGL